jgi:DNA-binding PadR family transcriptional regulator
VALPHAILVSLCEQSGSGYELARRFDRSIGYFWAATHQQIYRTLKTMEDDGCASRRRQQGRPEGLPRRRPAERRAGSPNRCPGAAAP